MRTEDRDQGEAATREGRGEPPEERSPVDTLLSAWRNGLRFLAPRNAREKLLWFQVNKLVVIFFQQQKETDTFLKEGYRWVGRQR